MCWAVLVPTGVDGQRFCLCLALGLGDYPSITGLTVHVPDRAALSTAPTALQEGVTAAGRITGTGPQAPQPVASPDKRNSFQGSVQSSSHGNHFLNNISVLITEITYLVQNTHREKHSSKGHLSPTPTREDPTLHMSSSVPDERDRWRQRQEGKIGMESQRQGENTCRETGTGKGMQTDTETRRDGVRRGGDREVISGVMSTLVSGQEFESLKEWKGGYYTLLLLSLLQIDVKTKAKKSPQARAPFLF